MEGKFLTLDQFSDEINNGLNPETNSTDEALEGCLIVKPAKTWIEDSKQRPIPRMLFSEFWFENELCILFADTNLGKSILAVQICDSISRGHSVIGFKLEIEPTKVVYFDFELSDKQFENRYSQNYSEHYQFNNNFLRAEINSEQSIPENYKSFEEYLYESIEKLVDKEQIKILIVDNITYLRDDTEKAKDALNLMKSLNSLKKKHNLSILVLAHTPKRDATKPISKNDVSGSKMLMNFCDSSFAIGESFQDKSMRYLKQIKQRNTEHIFDSKNVAVCKIEKKTNFLEFIFQFYDSEYEHLKVVNQHDNNEERDTKILELKNQGISNVKIGEKLGISEGTVRNVLKKLKIE